ncbi:MAG: response regulator [Nitriliruptor sp.]|nr:MAG: response regulator [Nitriliruptor sp.]
MARVLIVDDDPIILELVVMNFELEGHEVRTAANGPDALDLAGSWSPDAIILDVMMPGLSGFEVCQQLRDEPSTAEIPVVLLSARALGRDVEEGLAAGAVAYVTKPFDPLELVEQIEQLVRGAPAGP